MEEDKNTQRAQEHQEDPGRLPFSLQWAYDNWDKLTVEQKKEIRDRRVAASKKYQGTIEIYDPHFML